MTCNDFLKSYWRHYIMIENEFIKTTEYVDFDVDNYKTFSQMYLKLILECGSEIDVVFKELCIKLGCVFKNKDEKNINKKTKITSTQPNGVDANIHEYILYIWNHQPAASTNFFNQSVTIDSLSINTQVIPWENNDKSKIVPAAPDWWEKYNLIKHNRIFEDDDNDVTVQKNYKYANLENCLYTLAGLYQLEMYLYYELANEANNNQANQLIVPLPSSRIFEITDGVWSNITFFNQMAFTVNNNGEYILNAGNAF